MADDAGSSTVTVHDEGDVDGAPAGDEVVVDEVLVEEISIDGMCGVY